jgi:hypothetical protein
LTIQLLHEVPVLHGFRLLCPSSRSVEEERLQRKGSCRVFVKIGRQFASIHRYQRAGRTTVLWGRLAFRIPVRALAQEVCARASRLPVCG